MNKEEYFEFQDQYFEEIKTLTKKKNADYTGSGDNPFKNFEHVGSYNQKWILIGFFTRMSDKFARVASYIEKGSFEIADESIKDTLQDLSNYPCLMAGYIEAIRRMGKAGCDALNEESKVTEINGSGVQHEDGTFIPHPEQEFEVRQYPGMPHLTQAQMTCKHEKLFTENGSKYGSCVNCNLELRLNI